jgi:hypothetical protein
VLFSPVAARSVCLDYGRPGKSACTISCKKKNVEKRFSHGDTLTSTTWFGCGTVPSATFVARHVRSKSGMFFAAGEEAFQGAEKCL